MSFTSETWLALCAVVLIGTIIIGLGIVVGKWIIWLFGTECEVGTPFHRDEEAEKSIIRGAA